MITKQKPRIGFLGLMQGLYDESQPELPKMQEAFAREVVEQLKDVADIDFPGPAKEREDIERYVKYFNDKEYDGIMIVNLLYSPGNRLIQAMKNNNLPILLANIQPLPDVTSNWDWILCTTNQGIHGIQDTSNVLMRCGIKPAIITDDWKAESFKAYFEDWALAANTHNRLKKTKVAIFGRMHNMGDILGDDAALCRKFGVEANHVTIGPVYYNMEGLSDKEVDAQIEEDKKNFKIDPNLPEESHRYAARMQLAFEKFLNDNGYEGFSQFFNIYKEDGRFKQIPILAGSSLLAKGYGYSAEGDTNVLLMTVIGHMMIGDPHFTEMYSLDFGKDSAMLSHMGEGNWKVARKDRGVTLIDRPLDIGGLGNPPTPKFNVEPGTATLVSLVAVEGEKYQLIVSKGTILDTEDLPDVPMNHAFFRPDSGIKKAMDEWLANGGTHHEVLFLGDFRRRFELLCKILDIKYIEV
ncbi:L-arabinose isomerase family protein [Ruminiclostridium cellulolyticum]|uniref:L-arabinose isomerase n=1 Tax=Ruminiclostridium cellulolyticum (strain ATCC 35319 / DSM 5812 / JCM 6584 / H10) TaxID=394503 RepID=B8I9D5_RUMCH|nr:arabinose isomerase [Ruminiclostridium cellulolyticum]ACL75395.1 L-arabinose isomerase [Ruminiclostridium cellulolyticum H10]